MNLDNLTGIITPLIIKPLNALLQINLATRI